jgi:xanthine dehydrogenase molybdenum-binding subunit
MVSTFEPKSNYKVIGTRPIRHDGLDKVTGRAVYGGDMKLPGMLWGVVVRSPHAHARIKSIDTSAAEAIDGVFAVMTGKDLPQQEDKMVDMGEGSANMRWTSDNIMASDKALYRGHAVAAVAATDRYLAEEAAAAIKVEYEVLPSATDVKAALAAGAPVILSDLVGDDLGEEIRNTNIASHFRHEFGDLDAGFAKADVIVEREFSLQMVHQGYIEPHNATAIWDQDDRVRIWTSTQGAFPARTSTAEILKLSESRVKVTPLEIGGGFGGKIPIYLEPIVAILSKKSGGRPVKSIMERRSVFEATGPASGGIIRMKLGATKAGKLIAADTDMKFEAGAYPGAALGAAAMCVFSSYDIANTRIDGWDVVVNKPKSAAYRAPGVPQAIFAMESAVDELCELGGFEKMKFREDNQAHEGSRRGDGVILSDIGAREVIEATKASRHWQSPLGKPSKPGNLRGRGLSLAYWFNIGLKSSVNLSLNNDGTVELIEGSTDIGGSRAAMAMQAAEVLGLAAEDVRPTVADTESVGYTDVTGGSRTTYATGYATWKAAMTMVDELKNRASKLWNINVKNVQFEDGVFSSTSDSELKIGIKDLAGKLGDTGGPVNSTGAVDLESAGGSYGMHVCDVEIDPETGKTDVIRYTAVQDVGTAIHPSYVEGQIQGGVVQGIGWALNEEYFMNNSGAMANSSFLDYRMPTALDLPSIETVLVEVPSKMHPFGVRGVGEIPICPPIAAVANAIHDALDVRLVDAPMNPGRITAALEQKVK